MNLLYIIDALFPRKVYCWFSDVSSNKYHSGINLFIGAQDALTKAMFCKNDRDNKLRNSKRSKIDASCEEEPIAISLKRVSCLNQSSEIEKCVVFNEPDSTNQLLLPHPEVLSKENISNAACMVTDSCLIDDSSSSTIVKLQNFTNCNISQNLADNSDALMSNRKVESNRQQSTPFDRNVIHSASKRKPNRKIVDSVEKKMKKSDTLSISKPDTFYKNCKSFGKNPVHFQYSKSTSDSPMKILRDNLEIYDSLSDIDQGIVLEEDFSYQKSYQCLNCSNLLDIDWSGIKYNIAFNGQADSISPSCLLSQVGVSYSLLGSDIYTQCLNKIFDGQINSKGYSQGLSIGAIFEEIIFLEKEKLRIEFEQISHFGFVKTKDIYFRAILSGYSVDILSNPIPISGNSVVSSCMSTDLFHSALNIYHNPDCVYK